MRSFSALGVESSFALAVSSSPAWPEAGWGSFSSSALAAASARASAEGCFAVSAAEECFAVAVAASTSGDTGTASAAAAEEAAESTDGAEGSSAREGANCATRSRGAESCPQNPPGGAGLATKLLYAHHQSILNLTLVAVEFPNCRFEFLGSTLSVLDWKGRNSGELHCNPRKSRKIGRCKSRDRGPLRTRSLPDRSFASFEALVGNRQIASLSVRILAQLGPRCLP